MDRPSFSLMPRTTRFHHLRSGLVNHARGSFRTRAIRLLAVILMAVSTVPPAHAAAAEDDSVLPAFEDVIPAWMGARGWLDTGEVPEADDDAARFAIADLSAVGVLLRLDGRVVGRGFDPGGDDLAVRRAFGRALAQALGDRTIRRLPEPWRSAPGARLCLELELAGPRQPLVGGTLAAAARRLRPGIDGVAVVRGETSSLALPGRMLSTGTADGTAGTLIRLLDEVGLPPKDLPDLRRIDSVRLERFETLRLGQTTPTGTPSIRMRLGSHIPRSPDLDDGLPAISASLKGRLTRWQPAPDPSNSEAIRPWLGDFDPIGGSHDPIEAELIDRLFGIWALSQVDPASTTVPRPEELPEESITPAVVDLALLAASHGRPEIGQAWLDRLDSSPEVPSNGPGERARRAAAIGFQSGSLVPDDRFDAAYDDAWTACRSLPDVLAAFDWLCLAELAWWRRHGEPGPRVDSLRAVRDSLLARQIDVPDSDLDGSIPLRAGLEEVSDARCLRLLLGMAALRTIPEEDPEGRGRAERGLAGLIRFLRQLQTTPEEAADLPFGRRADGGVQAGPADPRQPLIATAVALIAVDLLQGPV